MRTLRGQQKKKKGAGSVRPVSPFVLFSLLVWAVQKIVGRAEFILQESAIIVK